MVSPSTSVLVTNVLQGNVALGETIRVSELGGTYQGVIYVDLEERLPMKEGKEYLLFLAEIDKGLYSALNPDQARFLKESYDTYVSVSLKTSDITSEAVEKWAISR
jgi:hypothetical protein